MEETGLKVIDHRMQVEPTEPDDNSPNAIVMMAMKKNYDPALIEKMMDLAERNQANIARQAFFEALANFKAEAPPVTKDKYNNFFNSWYTSLGNLLDTYNPVLGKHGLSLSHSPAEQTVDTMTVTCFLTHRLGHRESLPMTAPIDKAAIGKESGRKSRNAIQDIKSTFTYLRSATAEAILGVAGTEATVNDDGNGSGPETITDEQVAGIEARIRNKNIDRNAFLKHMKITEPSEILAKNLESVIAVLDKAAGRISCPDKDGAFVPATDCPKCKNREGCPAHEVAK